MKKFALIFLITLSFSSLSFIARAQVISFCEDVKESGEMVHPSNTFAVTKKGGIIKMLVTLEHKVNMEKVEYKVFRVSDKGDQALDQTIEDVLQPEWLWFYHELFIRGPGNYMVYLYPRGSTEVLASGMVHILAAKE